jgi:rare lipoprotein A
MALDKKNTMRMSLYLLLISCFSTTLEAQEKTPSASKKSEKPAIDRSGKTKKGHASYYGREFYGKKMADGSPMDPKSNIAASRTLPLGTKAKVTNLDNGKSEVVHIRDRGPYIDGRIIDLTPKTAENLDMKEDGVARVAVTPIELPGRSGSAAQASGSSD